VSAGLRIGWIPTSQDSRIASARLRCALPSLYLRKAGWRSEVFEESRAGSYDVVVFQKVYDKDRLALAERLRQRGTATIFDLCDNHFYNPDDLPQLAERADRLRRMLDLVSAVSVSTEALAELVADRSPTVIDDALDPITPSPLGRARSWARYRLGMGRRIRLVWFGNAGTESPPFGLAHLPRINSTLEELAARRPLSLTVISNSRSAYERAVASASFPTRYVEWNAGTFRRAFPDHDICVLPIEPNPFTLCKTANRVALSLQLGVPVVTDPIPSFEDFAPFVQLGHWPESLERYADDAELRATHVREGRRYIASTYTPERVVAQWSALFERVAGMTR
jgi:hypothetical protein